MNIESVKSLFRLFSGEEDISAFMPIISLALSETEKMLVPGFDRSDVRIDFLCAAAANYRLQQIYAAHENLDSVFAGGVPGRKSNPAVLAYAEKLLADYMNMCSDIIVPKTFVFMTAGGEAETHA